MKKIRIEKWITTCPGYGIINEKVKIWRDNAEKDHIDEIELIGIENGVLVNWYGDVIDVPNGRIRLAEITGLEDDVDRFMLFINDWIV